MSNSKEVMASRKELKWRSHNGCATCAYSCRDEEEYPCRVCMGTTTSAEERAKRRDYYYSEEKAKAFKENMTFILLEWTPDGASFFYRGAFNSYGDAIEEMCSIIEGNGDDGVIGVKTPIWDEDANAYMFYILFDDAHSIDDSHTKEGSGFTIVFAYKGGFEENA